jgi:hypothetical protein
LFYFLKGNDYYRYLQLIPIILLQFLLYFEQDPEAMQFSSVIKRKPGFGDWVGNEAMKASFKQAGGKLFRPLLSGLSALISGRSRSDFIDHDVGVNIAQGIGFSPLPQQKDLISGPPPLNSHFRWTPRLHSFTAPWMIFIYFKTRTVIYNAYIDYLLVS